MLHNEIRYTKNYLSQIKQITSQTAWLTGLIMKILHFNFAQWPKYLYMKHCHQWMDGWMDECVDGWIGWFSFGGCSLSFKLLQLMLSYTCQINNRKLISEMIHCKDQPETDCKLVILIISYNVFLFIIIMVVCNIHIICCYGLVKW